MKPHKHADIIKDWTRGVQIQVKEDGVWVDDDPLYPIWYEHKEYRIKPGMNSRIKELAQQAGFDVELMQQNYDKGNCPIAYQLAELIIRECAQVALREDHEPSECILNHFGLEK